MIDIYYLGHSCFKISNRQACFLLDPFDPEFTEPLNAVLCTHQHKDHYLGNPVIIDGPGEYEVSGVKIYGLPSSSGTIYHINIDGVNIVHLGDLGVKLNEKQIEELDGVDILMISVATPNEVINQIEPSIVIPTHYKTNEELNYFLKTMGAEGVVPQTKLSVTKDKLPETRQTMVLSII